ncbi:sensor histidine kinase [Paenibacillus mendelii]|uniref:histidine kinase n=1 Tax=Paenibacillus mendelii TaxID=206163 RepID=A0ABV6J5R9_9BACL|nr:sensor histidine kinase [Paenibacillus mendelii]MCQ6559369.1 sensor histidine kinase [Paenibacillus mendelii]
MNKNVFRYLDTRAAHITFIVAFFILILPESPLLLIHVLFVYAAFAACYIWMAAAPKGWWDAKRYAIAVCVLAGITVIIRTVHFDYPDHRIFWPLLYMLGVADARWNRWTVVLAAVTVCMIFGMMMVDGVSYGALIAAVLMYIAVRNQNLLREADRTNRKQLEQLNAAYSELQQTTVQAMGYAALTERTRLARDIHDGLGHQMTSLIVQLQALKLMIPKDTLVASNSVDEILKVARKGIDEVRFAVKEWSDDEKGLGPIALKGLISQIEANSLVRIQYKEIGPIGEWPVECSVILYRILQEALTNILKHADASQVDVSVEEENEHVKLLITDDGNFRSEKPLNFGFGLSGMIERCETAGGSIAFSSNSPKGLKIQAVVPLDISSSTPD